MQKSGLESKNENSKIRIWIQGKFLFFSRFFWDHYAESTKQQIFQTLEVLGHISQAGPGFCTKLVPKIFSKVGELISDFYFDFFFGAMFDMSIFRKNCDIDRESLQPFRENMSQFSSRACMDLHGASEVVSKSISIAYGAQFSVSFGDSCIVHFCLGQIFGVIWNMGNTVLDSDLGYKFRGKF